MAKTAVHGILHLGGCWQRIEKTIEMALEFPTAPIIISSEEAPEKVMLALLEAGISLDRVHFDFAAWDTVSNFTKTARLVRSFGVTDLHVVTSDYHMLRSRIIGEAVYAFRGVRIHTHPWNDPAERTHEKPLRVVVDLGRSLIWWFSFGLLLPYNPWTRRVSAKSIATSRRTYEFYRSVYNLGMRIGAGMGPRTTDNP